MLLASQNSEIVHGTQLEDGLQASAQDLKYASSTIQADLDRFQRQKVADIREMCIAMARIHREWCRKVRVFFLALLHFPLSQLILRPSPSFSPPPCPYSRTWKHGRKRRRRLIKLSPIRIDRRQNRPHNQHHRLLLPSQENLQPHEL